MLNFLVFSYIVVLILVRLLLSERVTVCYFVLLASTPNMRNETHPDT